MRKQIILFVVFIFVVNSLSLFAQPPIPPSAPKKDNTKNIYSNNQIATEDDIYINDFQEYLIYNKGVKNLLLINRHDGILECFDYNFKKLWSFKPKDTVNLSNGQNEFSYSDGVIFTGYENGGIFAINAKDGSLYWKGKIGLHSDKRVLRSQSMQPYKNKLFISGWNNNIYALNASNGEFIWNYRLNYPYNSLPVLALNDTIYLQNAPYMHNFVAATGKPLYQRGFRKAMYGKPVTDGKLVIVANESDTVYGLRTTDLAPMWKYEPDKDDYNVNKKIFTISGKVFFATESNNDISGIYCLQSSDGKELWKNKINGDIAFIKEIGGQIYGFTKTNKIFIVNINSGKIEKEFTTQYQPLSNIELHQGDLFYYTMKGLVKLTSANGNESVVIPFQGKEASSDRIQNQIMFTD